MIAPEATDRDTLITDLLNQQQQLTFVDRFSTAQDRGAGSPQAKLYRDLLPAQQPGKGEQFAFEVDLDACSGCKSCVAACHSLNGLEETETWRSVGLLHGGTAQEPVIQHVTTACHHCVDPACLSGCPVEAYEKDPQTGIVRHLDDQCIGCSYCIFKCPYDVPKYSASKGIVRKCDMCQDRLGQGEAPACVQGCPTSAIRITVVDTQTVIEASEINSFLPGAPDPRYTIPATVYRTNRPLPRNLLPADYFSARPQHAHFPLIVMLLLTQMSSGAFVVALLLGWLTEWSQSEASTFVRPVHLGSALALGLIGLAAAVLHLGRPQYAFRALIGLRTSWLSREILVFGMFALMASLYAGSSWLNVAGLQVTAGVQQAFGAAAAIMGMAGVFCSVMIYVDTQRPFWNAPLTCAKFLGTAAVLGIPTALLISVATAALSSQLGVREVMVQFGQSLCLLLLIAALLKMAAESLVFLHLTRKQLTPLKRTAMLMTGELGLTTVKRFFFGLIGGVFLPGVLFAERTLTSEAGFSAPFLVLGVILILLALLIGEFLERFLFFTAVVAPRMPGPPAT